MKSDFYSDLSARINEKTGLVFWLNVIDKAITRFTVLMYALLLFFCLVQALWKVENYFIILAINILVPGLSFIAVSLFRKKKSAPRPYEVYGFSPAIKKDTVGKSFPSRHVFSIFIIATVYLSANVTIAILLYIIGLILAIIRVVGGVHFIKDVVAGALVGIFCGILAVCMVIFL